MTPSTKTLASPAAAALLLAATLAAPLATGAELANTVALSVAGARAYLAPPAMFDPLNATDAALARYGYPPRPDAGANAAGYASWARAMRAIKSHIVPNLKLTNIRHRPNIAAAASTKPSAVADATITQQSTNWSGAVDTNTLTKFNAKSSFSTITADYVIPVVSNPSCDGGWDDSSQWVGIDGYDSNDVLQAGTEADAYCNGITYASYYPWFEWYPNYESEISNLPVAAGDDMYVVVNATSATTGTVFIENLNSGVAASIALTAPSGTYLVGNSVEWIVERPEISGSLATLPNYVIDYFSSASAGNFSNKVFTPTQILLNMAAGSGVISSPSLLGKTSVLFQYQ